MKENISNQQKLFFLRVVSNYEKFYYIFNNPYIRFDNFTIML